MRNESFKSNKHTKIIISEEKIDTPYPYCIIPNTAHRFRSISGKIEHAKLSKSQPRRLLSVTTWDGRELLDMKALPKH